MPSYTLRSLRRIEPRCTDFTDEGLVREYELAMRVHRAVSEGFSVEPIDPVRRDGSYRVEGPTGGRYLVDIISDGGTYDACTCADFATNRLGTCKHIEAVRRALRDVPALRRLAAVPAPRMATLTVAARGAEPRLVAVGPRAGELARRLGMDAAGARLAAPEQLDQVKARVVHAVHPTLERLAESEARARRRHSLSQTVADGRFRLDVLAEPLFPYQIRGVAHLVTAGRALLADDMGLGKTVQAIAACEVLRLLGESERVLVVAPASLKAQWAREVERYARRNAVVVVGGPQERRALVSAGAPYTIINYELLWRDPALATAVGADVIILDEAQRAKNFRTKTASLLRALASRFLFVLTGTPVENRLDDLYSLMQLVDPGVFGPLWRFNLDFHLQTARNRRSGYRNLGQLRERIAPFVLRRHKDEVLSQLPPLVEQTRYVALSDRQAQLERDLRAGAAKIMAAAQKRALTPVEQHRLMALLLKARQACNAAELCDPQSADDGCAKLDELEQLVGEIIEQGAAKVLVFSEWTEMLRLCSARLDRMGVDHAILHGGVPTEKRPALLARFREDPAQRVLLSTDAGGVGLNLQAASYVIHLDLPWNPGRLDQRTARAHRLGQTRGVSVTYLCAATGIERGIEGTLAGKRMVRSAALDAASEIEAVDAPSFTAFIRELQSVMARVDAAETTADGETPPAALAGGSPALAGLLPERTVTMDGAPPEGAVTSGEAVSPEASPPLSPTIPSASPPPPAPPSPSAATMTAVRPRSRAEDRLRLADVVLAAGFGGDAVRAAYDALASAVRALLAQPVGPEHGALIAAAYRELVPAGRAPEGLLGTLARLRDLTLLEAEQVAVEVDLAAAALRDARAWVERLAPAAEAVS
jgi:hypothetical protein